MTPLPIVARSFLVQLLLSFPLSVSSTICGQVFLNQIPFAERLSIWTNTLVCSEHPEYPQMYVFFFFPLPIAPSLIS